MAIAIARFVMLPFFFFDFFDNDDPTTAHFTLARPTTRLLLFRTPELLLIPTFHPMTAFSILWSEGLAGLFVLLFCNSFFRLVWLGGHLHGMCVCVCVCVVEVWWG